MKQNVKHLIACVSLGFYGLLAYATPFVVNGIYYDIDASNNAYVTFDPSGSMYNEIICEIPSKVKNVDGTEYTVVAIGKKAFSGSPKLVKIKLPRTLKSIEESAFYNCDNLKRIGIDPDTEENRLPDAITAIGDNAFSLCSNLIKITLPSSLISIGRSAFSYCSGINSIVIPASVTDIAKSAFANCESLVFMSVDTDNKVYDSRGECNAIFKTQENILVFGCKGTNNIIPEGVVSIGENAFYGSGLSEVTLPSTLTTIGESAFYNCKLTSVTIPDAVESIGDNAFSLCSSLTSVQLSSSLLSIGRSAFSYSGLRSIIIPKSVLTIGKNAFANCEYLSSIQVENGNIFYSSPDNCNAIIQIQGGKLIVGCANTVFPSNVTSIGEGAFYGSGIGGEIVIPSTIKTIEESGFYNCAKLTKITMEDGVTTIGRYAFTLCSNLEEVYLPSSLTKVDRYAFHYCEEVTDIYSLITNPFTIDTSVFDDGHYNMTTLHVPTGTKSSYQQTSGWNFAHIEEFNPSGIFSPTIAMQRIYSDNGLLFIESATDGNCNIYSMSGQLIRKLALKKGTNTVSGLTKGIYVVNGQKIMVK